MKLGKKKKIPDLLTGFFFPHPADRKRFSVPSGVLVLDTSRVVSEAMVGDVNLFLNDPEDRSAAEVEIMIAGTCHVKSLRNINYLEIGESL